MFGLRDTELYSLTVINSHEYTPIYGDVEVLMKVDQLVKRILCIECLESEMRRCLRVLQV